MDHDEAAFAHVRQQDPDHTHRQVKIGGQVGDGGGQAAPAQHLQVLGLRAIGVGFMLLTADIKATRSRVSPLGRVPRR
jgi:hypothetical protein